MMGLHVSGQSTFSGKRSANRAVGASEFLSTTRVYECFMTDEVTAAGKSNVTRSSTGRVNLSALKRVPVSEFWVAEFFPL